MNTNFEIGGMHCGSCALDIKETLEETAGVERAEVSFDGKRAAVEFDERQITNLQLVKLINDLGYTADEKIAVAK